MKERKRIEERKGDEGEERGCRRGRRMKERKEDEEEGRG